MRAGKPRRSAIMMMNLNTSLMTQPLVTAWYWRRLPSAGKSCSCRATTSPTLFALIPSRLKSSGVRLVSKEARPACTSSELGIFCCNISIFYLVSHQVGYCDLLLPVLSKLGPMLADPSIIGSFSISGQILNWLRKFISVKFAFGTFLKKNLFVHICR